MCGITGIYSFGNFEADVQWVESAVKNLKKRGPDADGIYQSYPVILGHSRLAIIDTSEAASQPFSDPAGRFTIIFNGEIFNYQELKNTIQSAGVTFKSHSDTEVLLHLYILYGQKMLPMLNGFFALAVFDKAEQKLFVARDRFGIKPLYIYSDTDKFIFASEMKAIMQYPINKQIDRVSLQCYLQLNYIPSPRSVFRHVSKLEPGSFIEIYPDSIRKQKWYSIPMPEDTEPFTYNNARLHLKGLLEDAVRMRLVSDVPLGAFLSGGIDSSIIVALAAKYVKNLNTFTIGYRDEPFFDETKYARSVAEMYKTNHTEFKLSTNDLFSHFSGFLDYIDEPFADSSALAVYILSKYTRQHVTVALSGDGADELFGGYYKHTAHLRALNPGFAELMTLLASPLLNVLPKSRNNAISNRIRQLQRFAQGMRLSDCQRYWFWCSIAPESYSNKMLIDTETTEYVIFKQTSVQNLFKLYSLNEILRADQHMVLQGDMLVKTDMMSMANSLEIRVPFLDYRIVEFAQHLPASFKIDRKNRKKILRDTFRDMLPPELYNRPKHGFEVPLLKWMRGELFHLINNDLLSEDFIINQHIFRYSEVKKLKEKLFSINPREVQSMIWALIIFQYWWKKCVN